MNKKKIIYASDDRALKLKVLAKKKEDVRRKLAVTAEKLVVTAKEKESVRRKLVVTAGKLAVVAEKLAVTAKEKESVRNKLAITAKQLAATAKEKEYIRGKLEVTAKQLATIAKEKEGIRRKLEITAKQLAATAEEKEDTRSKLAITAKQLAATAEEKEGVRSKLAVTAKQLAATAEEKEGVRSKLAVTAKQLAATAEEKEDIRGRLEVTAKNLAMLAKEKESVRRRLAVTAKEKESVRNKLVVTAEEKESVRNKLVIIAKQLAVTAKEKESVRGKLVVTAKQLAVTAKQLAVTAKEKESVRRKLVITAEEKESLRRKLAVTAKEKESVRRKLAVTAKEKESVRRKLAVTAGKLKRSRETLENKVLERTKDLEQARAKDEAVLASIGDGLVAVDKEGKITYVNQAFEEMIGWKTQEVLGKSMVEIVPREDEKGNAIPFKEMILTRVLFGEKVIDDLTNPFYFIRKDKSRFPASIIAKSIILKGEIIGAVETFRDITKEKDIDKAKTEFVSLASHQLRTPLSAINWYTEMLLAGDAGLMNEEQKKYLGEVAMGSKRMVDLVNALLNVSRLDLGTFIVEPEPTNIVEIAKSIVDELKTQIIEKKLKVEELYGENIPEFKADKKLLRIVFQNLLSNAVKYTQSGGIIKMELAVTLKGQNFGGKDIKEDSITIKISDTGMGIPTNQKDKIFSKLFRADNARESETEGTGLGLYIVKSIVDHSLGLIWFKSEENKGATFYVVFPLSGMKKKEGTKKLD